MDVARSCRRYLRAFLTGGEEVSKALTVLRVRPTLTRFPIDILHWPVESAPLLAIPSMRYFGAKASSHSETISYCGIV